MKIISASRRTDIPAIFGKWFMDKIAKGKCIVANPFNGKTEDIPLTIEDVDVIVFWSRNYAPMYVNLITLRERGYKFYCHFTINNYPKYIDPGSPPLLKAVSTAHTMANTFGFPTVVWRYDPITLTTVTDAQWHENNFRSIAGALAGATDTCIISFLDMYRKVERNLLPVLARNGTKLLSPSKSELVDLTGALAEIGESFGISVKMCCEPDFDVSGVQTASCIDPARLEAVTGKSFAGEKKVSTRKGCNCIYAKDIGAYDTCVMGCAYCYANNSRKKSARNARDITPDAPSLWIPKQIQSAGRIR